MCSWASGKVDKSPLAAMIKLNPITFVFTRRGGGTKGCRHVLLCRNAMSFYYSLLSQCWQSFFLVVKFSFLFLTHLFFTQCSLKKKDFFLLFFCHSRLFSCASNHFGRRLESGEIPFVMADCVILLAHPETQMATLVSAVSWLSVDFTHRSLTITERCFFLANVVNTPRIQFLFSLSFCVADSKRRSLCKTVTHFSQTHFWSSPIAHHLPYPIVSLTGNNITNNFDI